MKYDTSNHLDVVMRELLMNVCCDVVGLQIFPYARLSALQWCTVSMEGWKGGLVRNRSSGRLISTKRLSNSYVRILKSLLIESRQSPEVTRIPKFS